MTPTGALLADDPLWLTVLKVVVIFVFLMVMTLFMVWMERKVCAYIQDREGPNRVGPAGLLQPFADVIKLVFKEDLRPKAASTLIFMIAPVISTATAFAAFSVVPFGSEMTLFGLLKEPIRLEVTDVNVAVLVIVAVTSANGERRATITAVEASATEIFFTMGGLEDTIWTADVFRATGAAGFLTATRMAPCMFALSKFVPAKLVSIKFAFCKFAV